MTESRSPRLKPSAASPSAKSRTCPRYSLHVHACQMPRSFSRMAARRGNSRALRRRSRGSVVSSAMLRLARLGVAEIRLHHGGIDGHFVRLPPRDLLAHVEDSPPVGDVPHHAPVAL